MAWRALERAAAAWPTDITAATAALTYTGAACDDVELHLSSTAAEDERFS